MKKTRLIFLGLYFIYPCATPQRPHEGPSVGHGFLMAITRLWDLLLSPPSNCCGVVDIFLTD
ncbi:MAG TPA: hypothetical protein DCM38_01165 [Gammaproteobacteria bacterium]|nr:hypothetical protein [Gammaproteobacteria bacterium]